MRFFKNKYERECERIQFLSDRSEHEHVYDYRIRETRFMRKNKS